MSEKFWTGIAIGGFGLGMWCLGCATGYWANKSEYENFKAQVCADLLNVSTTLNESLSKKLDEKNEESKEQEEA